MDAQTLVQQLPKAFRPAEAGGKAHTIQLNISQPAYAVIENGTCAVHAGTAPSSDLTLTMTDENFVELMQGRLNGVAAFMSGKLKASGDLMLAQRLTKIFDASALQS